MAAMSQSSISWPAASSVDFVEFAHRWGKQYDEYGCEISTCDTLPSLTVLSCDSLPGIDRLLDECADDDFEEADDAPATSIFAGGLQRLQILDSDGCFETDVMVHDGVLAQLPRLIPDAGSGSDARVVKLPTECPLASLNVLLARLYSGDNLWEAPTWGQSLGAGLPIAAGALLLAHMLGADALAAELLPVVRQRADSVESRDWLRALDGMLDLIPELATSEPDGNMEAAEEAGNEADKGADEEGNSLKEMVLSVMTQALGAREAQEALEKLLADRRRQAWGEARKEDGKILASVLLDVKAYIVLSSQLSVEESYVLDPGVVAEAPAHQHEDADYMRIVRLPADGFRWLCRLLLGYLEEDLGLAMDVIDAYEILQSCERTSEHPTPDTVLILDAPSRKALRETYAVFMELWARQLASGIGQLSTFIRGFSLATQSATAVGAGLRDIWPGSGGTGTCFNALHLVPTLGPSSIYAGSVDLLALVFETVCDDARAILLDVMRDLPSVERAFSSRAVLCLTGAEQQKCVEACSTEFLSAEICASLRGGAQTAARGRLMSAIGRLDVGQLAFIREGL